MNNCPIISLVAPIYGVEKYIGKFAESVLGQTYPHIQFVFVNDGTKDSSIDILNSVIDSKYAHLRESILIVNKENGGLPAARKTGMEYVTGDYVWHIDSDDWISEGAVQMIADFAMANNYPDFIYYDFYKEYAKKTKHKRERDYIIEQKDDYIKNMFNHKSYAGVWNKCVKRSIYVENGVYFPKYSYAEDTYLTSQLLGFSKSVAHLKAPLYHYRKDNPLAITRQKRKKRHTEYALNFLDLYEKYNAVTKEKQVVSCLFNYILIKVAWYSVFYKLDLFTQYKYLATAVKKAKINCDADVFLISQLIAKAVACFKK